MAFRLLAAISLALLLCADDRWLEFRSGPFEVITNAGEHSGEETLTRLDQLRHVLGEVLGKPEPKSVWPIRVLVLKDAKTAGLPALGRDAITASVPARGAPPRDWMRELVRVLIEANASRMPSPIEAGLADLYSTLEVAGTRVTLGQPLPPGERNLDWARVHLLSVQPNYYGKLRVLLHNLQQRVEPGPAWRNAFGNTAAEIDKEAAAYLAAGQFETVPLSGRPFNPRAEFNGKPVEALRAEVFLADLHLAARREAQARAAYQAILNRQPLVEAHEGLALLGGQENLDAAVRAGSVNARIHAAWAAQVGDSAKARAALEKAAALNPNWAEPQARLALLEPDAARKIQRLQAAARLEPRHSAHWIALARAQTEAGQFSEAARAWAAAESASATDAERVRVRQAREDFDRQRLELEATERRRIAEGKERELTRLKEEAIRRIREAEARANRDSPAREPGQKVEQWWEGEKASGKVQGVLQQVECRGRAVVLAIRGEKGKPVRLLIRDPAKVVVASGGELSLTCGPQKPARRVAVEYFERPDAKLSAAGEVAFIEFR